MKNHTKVGTLSRQLVAQFEKCFEIRFGRRVLVEVLPDSAAVYVRDEWPENHKKQMKQYFKGWHDCGGALAMVAQPQVNQETYQTN